MEQRVGIVSFVFKNLQTLGLVELVVPYLVVRQASQVPSEVARNSVILVTGLFVQQVVVYVITCFLKVLILVRILL